MSQEDGNKFSKKVTKSLNNLNSNISDIESIIKIIDITGEKIQADQQNIFVYIKEVFDELKKYKKPSDNPAYTLNDNDNSMEDDKTIAKEDIVKVMAKDKTKNQIVINNPNTDKNEKSAIENSEINSVIITQEPLEDEQKQDEQTQSLQTLHGEPINEIHKVSSEKTLKRKVEQEEVKKEEPIRKKVCLTTLSNIVP